MKPPTPRELIRLIRNEIEWCRKNSAPDIAVERQKGFIAGLEQAIFLISEAEKITRRNDHVG